MGVAPRPALALDVPVSAIPDDLALRPMRGSAEVAWWAVGVAAVLAVLGGCGASSTAGTSDDRLTGLDGPVMRHQEAFTGDGEDAEITGVVEIDGGCLFVSDYLVVWPATTSWDAENGRVILATGESVGPGDSVYGGGGYRPVGNVGSLAGGEAADLARECADSPTTQVAVVNNQRGAIVPGDGPVDLDVPTADPVDLVGLEGDWAVDELMVDGERIELDTSWPVTATVEGETISGTAACNRYTGTIDWSAEAGFGRFVVSDLTWTEKACDSPSMKVEQAFLDALQIVDSYEAADGLYVGKLGAATNFRLVRAN